MTLLPAGREEIITRARGAFIGLAVGDALGAPVEFMTAGRDPGEIRHPAGHRRRRLAPAEAGRVTDDTEMALCIARAMVAAGGWSLTGIADNFAAWLKSKPVDVGDTCRRGIRNYILHGRLETPFNQWDAGNGAVMRMLPVALFSLGDDWLLMRDRPGAPHPQPSPLRRRLHLPSEGSSTWPSSGPQRPAARRAGRAVRPVPDLPLRPLPRPGHRLRGRHHADGLPPLFPQPRFRGMPDRHRQPGGGRRHHRRHRRRPGRGLLRPGEHPETVAEKDEPGGHRRSDRSPGN